MPHTGESPPVDAGALDAQRDAQVNAGPLGRRFPAVTALGIALQPLHLVHHVLVHAAPQLPTRGGLQLGRGEGGRALQGLQRGKTEVRGHFRAGEELTAKPT